MDFVDKEEGFFATCHAAFSGALQRLSQVCDRVFHATEWLEKGLRCFGNNACQSCFAGSRRAIQENGRDASGLDGPAQKFARPKNMLLPRVFVQRRRAHPFRQWGVRGGRTGGRCVLGVE